jgi:hypothetical protein
MLLKFLQLPLQLDPVPSIRSNHFANYHQPLPQFVEHLKSPLMRFDVVGDRPSLSFETKTR